jgi:broad specificity phosphatase PhoE
MARPRIFLLRHGQSTFNASWDRTGRDPGHVDARLTALGHEQVREIAPGVRDLGVQLVVTSPATRCLETTLGLFEAPSARPAILVEPVVRDRFAGDSCDLGRSRADLERDFPALDFGRLEPDWWLPGRETGYPLTETREAFARRVAVLGAWLRARSEGTILVVGHDGTFRILSGVRMANCQLKEWDCWSHAAPS